MSKIVRTPTKVTGGITPEEKARLDAHAAKWIANAMSTEPVAPERLVPAIKALYAAAGLKEPRVVIVPSPMVMAFSGGFAAAIWWARKNNARALNDGFAGRATYAATYAATYDATDDATYAATYDATRAATDDATYAATYDATHDATRAATDDATYDATYDATRAATDDATYDATRAATDDATYAATYDATHDATRAATDDATYAATYDATYAATDAATRAATDDATYAATRAATDDATYAATDAARFASLAQELGREFGVNPELMLRCSQNWGSMYQGGNMWSYWDCYLSSFRDVLGLVLPQHEKYRAWESCTIEGGFRVMHEEFCIVSDRPEVLKVDDQNRPHAEAGPSHRWRDGWSLYHWHGVSIPSEWVTGKPPTAKEALTWPNVEQRRAACEIVGWANVLEAESLNPKIIDQDQPHIGTLIEVDLPDAPSERFIKYRCGTGRWFAESVNDKSFDTALKANAGGNGWRGVGDPESFIPFIRT